MSIADLTPRLDLPDATDPLPDPEDRVIADAGSEPAAETADGARGWRGIRRADGVVPSLRLLVELALDPLLPPGLRAGVRESRSIVTLVIVPGPAWVAPVREALTTAGGASVRCHAVAGRPRPGSTRDPDRDASDLLAEGEPLMLITPDADYLSPILVAAADHVLDVPPLDARLVARAIRIWCGRHPRRRIAPGDLAGLDLLDVAGALRGGATPGQCLARLRRASRVRVGVPEAEAAPPLAALAGYGPAHGWAMDLVADIGRVRRGAMKASRLEAAVFFGIPGTGKSTLARAIAQGAGVLFVETSVAEWFVSSSGNLDGVVKAAGAFFDALALAAKSHGTAIGFLDELDALPNRARLADRGADWWLPVITYVLLRVEAVRRSGVVLLAATNDLTRIDAALLRPGRFDRRFEIPPPDEAGRIGILRTHLGGDLPDADLVPVARLTPGATGAVLAGAVRAARRRAEAEGRPLAVADLLAELAPPDPRSPEAQGEAALHEAGHALVAHRLGHEVVEVTIQPRPGRGGATLVRLVDPTPDRAGLERQVVGLLAGRAADVVLGPGATMGAALDLSEATRLLAAIHAGYGLGTTLRAAADLADVADLTRTDPALAALVEADLQRLLMVAQTYVAADRAAIQALVAALLAKRVVSGAEVVAIAAAHPPRVRVLARRGPARSSSARTTTRPPAAGPVRLARLDDDTAASPVR